MVGSGPWLVGAAGLASPTTRRRRRGGWTRARAHDAGARAYSSDARPRRHRRSGDDATVSLWASRSSSRRPSRVVGAAFITASSPASPGARRMAHACAPVVGHSRVGSGRFALTDDAAAHLICGLSYPFVGGTRQVRFTWLLDTVLPCPRLPWKSRLPSMVLAPHPPMFQSTPPWLFCTSRFPWTVVLQMTLLAALSGSAVPVAFWPSDRRRP